jgi:hypothetical protein
VKEKGVGIEGILQIAMGNKQEGVSILKDYLAEESKDGELYIRFYNSLFR